MEFGNFKQRIVAKPVAARWLSANPTAAGRLGRSPDVTCGIGECHVAGVVCRALLAGTVLIVCIRLALDRAIPVEAITSSRIRPRSVLDAFAYAVRSLFVTCLLAAIGILPSTQASFALKLCEAPATPTRSKKLRHVDPYIRVGSPLRLDVRRRRPIARAIILPCWG